MDPILEEILRVHDARDIQPHALRRWQQHLRATVAPALDRLEALEQPLAEAADEPATKTRRAK